MLCCVVLFCVALCYSLGHARYWVCALLLARSIDRSYFAGTGALVGGEAGAVPFGGSVGWLPTGG